MKKLRVMFLGVFFGLSANAYAGDCETLATNINAWLAGDNHLVRVVTTLNKDGNDVSYTRGYLEFSETEDGSLVALSRRYVNTAPNGAFAETDSDKVTLKIFAPMNGAIQLNYAVEAKPNESAAFLTQCSQSMLYTITGKQILTVSFRFSEI